MRRRACGWHTAAATLVALAVLATVGDASASAATVVFVPPAAPSAPMVEALLRARAELASEGFVVEVVVAPTARDLREGSDWLVRLQSDTGADAVVAMLGEPVPEAVEIRVIDRVSNQPIVRRMSFHPASDVTAKALAIHTLELIRATFLELNLVPAPRPRAQPPQQPPAAVQAAAMARPPERLSIDVGAAAVFDFAPAVTVVRPLVRVSWAMRPWLLPHLTIAALGTGSTISRETASAQVSQQSAIAGAAYRFRSARRLRPFLSLSAGVLHTSAQGQAEPPGWAREAAQWSFVLDGAAGAWLSLGARFQAALALEAQVADPYPALRFSGTVVATLTRPSFLLTLTLGVWL